jgi:hypothetical protein
MCCRMKERELKLVKEQLAQSKIEGRELKSELRDVYSRMQVGLTPLGVPRQPPMASSQHMAVPSHLNHLLVVFITIITIYTPLPSPFELFSSTMVL